MLNQFLGIIQTDPKIENNEEKIKLCMFLNYFLQFYKLPNSLPSQYQSVAEKNKIPILLFESLLSKFSVAKLNDRKELKHVRTKPNNDALISHILILILHIEGFQINPRSLAKQLKIEESKIVVYLKEIGCVNKENMYVLVAPLVLPKIKKMDSKR